MPLQTGEMDKARKVMGGRRLDTRTAGAFYIHVNTYGQSVQRNIPYSAHKSSVVVSVAKLSMNWLIDYYLLVE